MFHIYLCRNLGSCYHNVFTFSFPSLGSWTVTDSALFFICTFAYKYCTTFIQLVLVFSYIYRSGLWDLPDAANLLIYFSGVGNSVNTIKKNECDLT